MEKNDLGRYESILLRKLYFAPFVQKSIGFEAGTLSEIASFIGDVCSIQHRYTFLHKMIDQCVLQPAGEKSFIVDKEAIVRLLLQDRIFRLDYAIIDEEAAVLLDDFPKIDYKLL